jgi:hypothetical protein
MHIIIDAAGGLFEPKLKVIKQKNPSLTERFSFM